MKYRRFGRTELQMPVFTCGGMRYQHKWQDVPMEEIPKDGQANLEACIWKSVELGINHIETARGYGTSEMQLGAILPRLPREKIIVQTKVAPSANAQEFLETFETSLRYLKLEHVDLLSIHGINNAQLLDWSLGKGGCLEMARRLQREGRARFIGFSTHATPEIILRTVKEGDFDYVNLHWYFVNETTWPAVEAASALDMGVFIISPNDKGGKLYAPPSKLVQLCGSLHPMQFNDLFCLARPQVHTLSLGVSRPSDFDIHVEALRGWDQADATVQAVEARLRAEMGRTLGEDWCARWSEGIPEYYDVPGEINLREILRLWTYAKSLDLIDWAKMRYNLLGQAEHWFPGEPAVNLDESAIRHVVRLSPFADRVLPIIREAHQMFYVAPVKRLSQS